MYLINGWLESYLRQHITKNLIFKIAVSVTMCHAILWRCLIADGDFLWSALYGNIYGIHCCSAVSSSTPDFFSVSTTPQLPYLLYECQYFTWPSYSVLLFFISNGKLEFRTGNETHDCRVWLGGGGNGPPPPPPRGAKEFYFPVGSADGSMSQPRSQLLPSLLR
jgi:hypothetical protein